MNIMGIEYTEPKVYLLQDTGIGVPEVAARTCYDSFEASENLSVKNFNPEDSSREINDIMSSNLLDSLAWVHHHHSIIEHATVSYLVKGTSRGVLQEHARHRVQSISVRSTRYTMSSVLNAFNACVVYETISEATAKGYFYTMLKSLDMFVVLDQQMIKLETDSIYDKLSYMYELLGKEAFLSKTIAKSSLELFKKELKPQELFEALQSGKKKRNVGDGVKGLIVSDMWKVDMVITFNIRSLKNYFDLRDSGAAWHQIQWLAKAMKEVTPKKYLRLIDKDYK